MQVTPEHDGTARIRPGAVVQGATGATNVTFADGSSVRLLADGLNNLSLRISTTDINTRAEITLSAQTMTGAVLATMPFHIGPPEMGDARLQSLRVSPGPALIATEVDSLQINVLGLLSDGRFINVTRPETGTLYEIADARIATIDPAGLVSPRAGGTTEVSARNGELSTSDLLTVQRDAVLTGLDPVERFVTLTTLSERRTLAIVAGLSDESQRPAAGVPGTTFTSSTPGVVAVDAAGALTPVADGTSTITVTNGTFTIDVSAAVELRSPTTVTEIDLAPIRAGVTTDQGEVQVQATVTGSGSLGGISVTFSVVGGNRPPVASLTSHGGVAVAMLEGLGAASTLTVTASVVNPATGSTLTDAESVTILQGSADNEPNSSDTTASRLGDGRTVNGALNGSTDSRDTFRTDAPAAGTLTITFTLPNGVTGQGVTLIVRNASGVEVARFTPNGTTSRFTVQATEGQTFISVEKIRRRLHN